MSHMPLVLALTLATGLAVAATLVQATVAAPAAPAFTIRPAAALS